MPVDIVLASAVAPSTGTSLTWLTAWLPAIAMIAGIVVIGAVMMAFFHRRERQLKALAAQIAGDLEEARALRAQLEDVHVHASNMMVTAQRLAARLDERVAALDLASLRMSATRNALPSAVTRPLPERFHVTGAPGSGPTNAAAAPSARLRLSGSPRAVAEIENTTPLPGVTLAAVAEPPPMVGPVLRRTSVPDAVDPLAARVHELADSGFTSVAIARELDEQVGKVELILALRRQAS